MGARRSRPGRCRSRGSTCRRRRISSRRSPASAGTSRIPEALPRGLGELEPERTESIVERRIRAALAGQGLDEVVNYSFVAPAELAAFEAEPGAVAVANPLSVEQSVMRTTLYAGLVPNVVRSARHQATGVRFYELARTYRPREGGGQGRRRSPPSASRLAGALWGVRDGAPSWTAKDAPVDFYDARAAVEAVLAALHIEGVTFEPLESPWYHPRAAAEVRHRAAAAGHRWASCTPARRSASMRRRHLPLPARRRGAARRPRSLVPQATPLSRFPRCCATSRSWCPVDCPAEQVRSVILEVGRAAGRRCARLRRLHRPAGGRRAEEPRLCAHYRAADRTLTDAEVAEAHQKIVAEVDEAARRRAARVNAVL